MIRLCTFLACVQLLPLTASFAVDSLDISLKGNLVLNSSFELPRSSGLKPRYWHIHEPTSNAVGWSWSYVYDPDQARSGNRCMVLSSVFSRGLSSDRLYIYSDDFSISHTNQYIFRVWYRTEGVGDGEVLVRIKYLDSSDAEIYSGTTGIDASDGEWSPLDMYLHPPDESSPAVAVKARAQIYLDHSPGTLWIDDVGVYELHPNEVPAVYPFGRFRAPPIETNGPVLNFGTGVVSVGKGPDGAWWMVSTNGAPFYLSSTGTGVSENETLTNYLFAARGMTWNQYTDEAKVRAGSDLHFNAGYRTETNVSTRLGVQWLNFSTESDLSGTDWVMKDAQGDTFGDSGHYFPDPFDPVWRQNATNEAKEIEAWFVEKADVLGYWTDNEWAYGAMSDHFWSDHCKTALVAWLQGNLDVPEGFEHPQPYTDIAQVNAAWSSPYHTYTYGSFSDIHGSDKPRVRTFDDPVATDLHRFERVVYKTYADTVINAVREREQELIAQLVDAGSTGYHHMVMSCRIGWDGPGFEDMELRRNMDLLSGFDVIAVNAYPSYLNASDHPPRSWLEAMKKTLHDTTGRPVLVSEFGIAARDSGVQVGRWHDRTVNTQDERGRGYRNLCATWGNLPWMVGHRWFKWANGYGVPEGSDPRNCGLVDDSDQYYSDLTNWIVRTNIELDRIRRRGSFTLDEIDWRDIPLPVYDGTAPHIQLLEPNGQGDTGTVSYAISWIASDPDSEALITLYAATNADLAANGIPIADELVEGVDTQFVWQVAYMPPGDYYIVAGIRDGTGPSQWHTSPGTVVVNGMADDDGDGMPNAWELRHFDGITNASRYADEDGDGFLNFREYIADTDPTNGQSFFQILNISNAVSPRLYFDSSADRTYSLQFREDMTAGQWSSDPDQSGVPGSGDIDSLHDTNSPGRSRVYRIGVEIP